ncbi:hypothetical protein L9F63_027249, partial [Diploptera punctata]
INVACAYSMIVLLWLGFIQIRNSHYEYRHDRCSVVFTFRNVKKGELHGACKTMWLEYFKPNYEHVN